MFLAWNYAIQSYFKWEKIRIFFESSKNTEFYEVLWHNKDTFWWKKGLMDFLSKNPSVSIFIDAGEPDLTFKKVEWGFLIWIKAFYEFQKNISGSDAQKVDAFLKQKSNIHNSTYSEAEKVEFISSNTTEENISDIINKLSPEKQKSILSFLKTKLWEWWDFNLKSDAEWVFLAIGNIENREIVIEQLKKLEKNNFANIESALSISKIDKILNIWEANKNNSDEWFWQKLFEEEDYLWVFQQLFPYPIVFLQWETYVGGKNSKWRNWQGGVVTDFLGQNLSNNSFALIEIKTPETPLIHEWSTYRGDKDSWNNNEIYSPNWELSWAIIQIQNQIETGIEDFLTGLWKDFSKEWLNHLHPHWILLVWKLDSIIDRKKASFLLFRKTMKDITIVTFDELFDKIKSLRKIYE